MDKKLLSLVLFSYNQRPYLPAAVASVLAQTYSPLQIILSDDASTDGSADHLVDIANRYTGPHEILLNLNPHNLGFAEHINQVVRKCRGELIIVAAGDDISEPTRAEALFQSWKQTNFASGSLYSSFQEIDEHGVRGKISGNNFSPAFPRMVRHFNDGVHGCTHAWTPDLFTVFGPLRSDVVLEDRAIPFRAVLIGKITFLPTPLVRYRRSPQSLSSTLGEGSKKIQTKRKIAVFKNALSDVRTAERRLLIPPPVSQWYQCLLQDAISDLDHKLRRVNSSGF